MAFDISKGRADQATRRGGLMKDLKKEAHEILRKWSQRLFLQEWYIDVQFPEKQAKGDSDFITLADIDPNPVYMEAKIRIYPAWFDEPPKVREFTLIHELCHCLTEELYKHIDDLQEGRVVTRKNSSETLEKLTQRMANVAFRSEWKN
jgi:hypothetical protein